MHHHISFAAMLLALTSAVHGLDNGLARTPPMGWNSWERFRCNIDCTNDPLNCISENLYMQMADAMASGGYREAGYEFINMDDCWMSKSRDAQGRLQPDPTRFPHGIKALADYIHSKGLKFGLYQSMGTGTCQNYPGIWGHIDVDVQTYADWGVDFLKMDACHNLGPELMGEGFINTSKALNATHRPIVFSCEWAHEPNPNFTQISEYCNSLRDYNDMQDSWVTLLAVLDWFASVQDVLAKVSGPGSYNDADFLIIGDFSLSVEQAQSQLALWTMLSSQLLMSNDLRHIDPRMTEVLLNREVLAVNQDKLGKMGRRIYQNANFEIWTRELDAGCHSAVFFNRDIIGPAYNYTTSMKGLGFTVAPLHALRDLFAHQDLGLYWQTDDLNVSVKAGSVLMILATPTSTNVN